MSPRKRRTRKDPPKNNPLALDRMFDLVVERSFTPAMPAVLYHYTNWRAAAGILTTQEFWATAHDCTNDEAELKSADAIIMEVARHLRRTARGAAALVLDLFLEGYPSVGTNELKTVYLTSFSAARDDKEQWRKYADNGQGLCLGVRILAEPPPVPTDRRTATLEVVYSESSWRANVLASFRQICSVMERAAFTRRNGELGLSALYRIAAFAAIGAKQQKWAGEQEFRNVTMVYPEAGVQPRVRTSGGKGVRYLPTVVRADGKKIALAEVVVGPNQDFEDARQRLIKTLADCGYEIGTMEYPTIVASAVAPWLPSPIAEHAVP